MVSLNPEWLFVEFQSIDSDTALWSSTLKDSYEVMFQDLFHSQVLVAGTSDETSVTRNDSRAEQQRSPDFSQQE